MKILLGVLSVALLAMLGCLAYVADQWVGLAAYTFRYLLFCIITALFYWAAWLPVLKKRAFIVGVAVFAILASNFLLQPSERILRSVLLRVPAGTSAESIEEIVKEEYDGSGYVLPEVTREGGRVCVSLLSQEAGNCTALIIHIKDGVVVSSGYSAD